MEVLGLRASPSIWMVSTTLPTRVPVSTEADVTSAFPGGEANTQEGAGTGSGRQSHDKVELAHEAECSLGGSRTRGSLGLSQEKCLL